MAFGNGAPDIFAAIASVLSTNKPKLGLALGGLLGKFLKIYMRLSPPLCEKVEPFFLQSMSQIIFIVKI